MVEVSEIGHVENPVVGDQAGVSHSDVANDCAPPGGVVKGDRDDG
jgi:hypothetical protein